MRVDDQDQTGAGLLVPLDFTATDEPSRLSGLAQTLRQVLCGLFV